jgi:hypothetical protein
MKIYSLEDPIKQEMLNLILKHLKIKLDNGIGLCQYPDCSGCPNCPTCNTYEICDLIERATKMTIDEVLNETGE